ncbi:D-hexose-6-phosphate mutarotase [Guyparkeria hydrothermalis]|uniref:D-hexose-6-phosphate mutarotase n=1 Tax=Guyparkeria hydrothermalis TaxID=923 RepID=UPI00201FB514|nr:D-hexose-6-phosphate mutarotase [Guyparkeria hydrothermalis]MCL7743850.1 D-hexose-6-phosphate mutarotase [Guyparkeria hydrothermalis]
MIDPLLQRFEQPGIHLFERENLTMLELSNTHGTAVVSTLGATVISYVPTGEDEVIWVSDTARYDGSKPIRGGIPVCWPWFGPHPSDPTLPTHGFARRATWELVDAEGGEHLSCAVLRLQSDATTASQWPWPFRLELELTLGQTLAIDLRATNLSEETWTVSEALHSYFRVANARSLPVAGLDGLHYWDKQRDGLRGTQDTPLEIEPPFDRVYFGHENAAVIHDQGRDIRIGKSGSRSTVVWNPGPEGAAALGDMPDDAWPQMLCVETANARDDAYSLGPGQTHTLTANIAVSAS